MIDLGWITYVAIYFVIWWITIFMVLPWGNEPIGPDDIAKGQQSGAPKDPRLLLKAGVNTLISGALLAVIFICDYFDLVTLREP